ncbi:MAG: disulfide reductase, partial [Bacteroidales bacterium]|nr:disulfide reductase [Bacteroidales bacterium]
MNKKIGVFVCHCGINISSNVDVEELTEYSKKLDNVKVAKNYKYMCSDNGAKLIKESIKKHNLDSIVIACCSP